MKYRTNITKGLNGWDISVCGNMHFVPENQYIGQNRLET